MVTDRQPRTRVAVVFGGTSSEHGVSCLTAAGVLGALDPDRYEVVGIGITRSGRWVLVEPEAIAALQVSDGRLPELSEDASDAMLLRDEPGERTRRTRSVGAVPARSGSMSRSPCCTDRSARTAPSRACSR